MISKEEKKEIVGGIIGDLKKEIIMCGLNIRYLEREKVRKPPNLVQIETSLKNWKMTKEGLEAKLEVAEDELSGK